MFAEVLGFLTDDGWPVEPDTFDDLPCIHTRFDGSAASWDCRARPYDPFGQLAFESILPLEVPAPRCQAMAELVVRTNWRLLTGAFQIDLDTGAMVFRTMLFLSHGAEPTDELLRGLVYGNVLTTDRCLAPFQDLVAGTDAASAFADLAL